MNVLSDSSVYYNSFNYDIKVKITVEDYLMLLLKYERNLRSKSCFLIRLPIF